MPKILVTGLCRTGTTWVGKILSYNNLQYIGEPFSPAKETNRKIMKKNYEYVCDRDPIERQEKIKTHLQLYIKSDNYLFKAPYALFSIKWLIDKFEVIPVITKKTALNFVASYKRHNWNQDLKFILKQEKLIEDIFCIFEKEIKKTIDSDIIDQAILMWKISEYYIKNFCNNCIIVKNEDLSLSPLSEFKKLYVLLGLIWNREVQKEIIATTTYGGEYEPYLIYRNSFNNVFSWEKILTKKEINHINKETNGFLQN